MNQFRLAIFADKQVGYETVSSLTDAASHSSGRFSGARLEQTRACMVEGGSSKLTG